MGVNFIDVYQREGVYPTPTAVRPRQRGRRKVVATGDGVGHVTVGDRVAWAMVLGSAARFATLPADELVPVPGVVDARRRGRGDAPGDDRPLPRHEHLPGPRGHGGGGARRGGRGRAAARAAAAGARGTVVATAGGRAKCATARARGADRVIDYRATDDLGGALREAVGGQGARRLRRRRARHLRRLARARCGARGMMVLFGASSGQVPPFDIQRLNSGGSLFLTRPSLGHYLADPRRAAAASQRAARRGGRRHPGGARWVDGTRWPRRRAPTPTSRAAAPRASCCSSPDRVGRRAPRGPEPTGAPRSPDIREEAWRRVVRSRSRALRPRR